MVNTDTKLEMPLLESKFPFSKRMLNFFSRAEIYTVGQLAEIPLSKFTCFRGFKIQCEKELAAFIEFEQIKNYFRE
jgi:hypothetical protein